MISKIISGGQTGVDRAALDVAIELGIPHGGWCPLGRLSEDGTIPAIYNLTETDSSDYRVRTQQNIKDADRTLIINIGRLTGGTLLTARTCIKLDSDYKVVDLNNIDIISVYKWLIGPTREYVLNVAGPRESKHCGIYNMARKFLKDAIVGLSQ